VALVNEGFTPRHFTRQANPKRVKNVTLDFAVPIANL
jgi:hypothetical protein